MCIDTLNFSKRLTTMPMFEVTTRLNEHGAPYTDYWGSVNHRYCRYNRLSPRARWHNGLVRNCYHQAEHSPLGNILDDGVTFDLNQIILERGNVHGVTSNLVPPKAIRIQILSDHHVVRFFTQPSMFETLDDFFLVMEVLFGNDINIGECEIDRLDFYLDLTAPFDVVADQIRVKRMNKLNGYGTVRLDKETVMYGSKKSGKTYKIYDKRLQAGLLDPTTRLEISCLTPKKVKEVLGTSRRPKLRNLRRLLERLLTDDAGSRPFSVYERQIPEFLYSIADVEGQVITPEIFDQIERLGVLRGILQGSGLTTLYRLCHSGGKLLAHNRPLIRFVQSAEDFNEMFKASLRRFLVFPFPASHVTSHYVGPMDLPFMFGQRGQYDPPRPSITPELETFLRRAGRL